VRRTEGGIGLVRRMFVDLKKMTKYRRTMVRKEVKGAGEVKHQEGQKGSKREVLEKVITEDPCVVVEEFSVWVTCNCKKR